jgi:hypothetical protein
VVKATDFYRDVTRALKAAPGDGRKFRLLWFGHQLLVQARDGIVIDLDDLLDVLVAFLPQQNPPCPGGIFKLAGVTSRLQFTIDIDAGSRGYGAHF